MCPLRLDNPSSINNDVIEIQGPVNIHGNTGPGMGPLVIFVLLCYGVTGYFEWRLYRVTGYFNIGFARDQRLF